MEDSIFENLLSGVDRNVMGSSAYDDIREKLTASYHNNHAYEGESFHILLDPLFEKTITDSARKLRTVGYPKVMDAIFSVEKGHICTNKTFPTSKLVPQISDTEENRLFMFLPLKEGKYSFGYLIFCDDIHKLSNYNRLFKYESRMNVILSKFRQNLSFNFLNKKLHEMNETDSLTQVKNRAAFERREAELNERMNSAHKPVYAIAMFDINNLKLVNDDYGHDYGDDYIIKCCRLVCETFKRSPVFRLGGDEFLALLTDFDYEERDLLMENMKLKMLSYKDSNLPPYETLSLASGLATYNPETDKELHDVFKRADAAMYENKAFMKGGAKSIR